METSNTGMANKTLFLNTFAFTVCFAVCFAVWFQYGVLVGSGGLVYTILFGYLLEGSRIRSSSWILIMFLSVIGLGGMHNIVQRMDHKRINKLKFEAQVN